MMHLDDDELRRRFAELRSADAIVAPPFEPSDAANRRSTGGPSERRTGRPVLALASVIGLVVVGLGVFFSRSERIVPPNAAELATWRSPTASLLRAPDAEVLSPSPLLSSVLDGATNSAIPRGGD